MVVELKKVDAHEIAISSAKKNGQLNESICYN